MVSHLDCRAALLRAAIIKKRLNEIYVKHTGQLFKKIEDALERDTFLTPEMAKDFGLIDKVIEQRPGADVQKIGDPAPSTGAPLRQAPGPLSELLPSTRGLAALQPCR